MLIKDVKHYKTASDLIFFNVLLVMSHPVHVFIFREQAFFNTSFYWKINNLTYISKTLEFKMNPIFDFNRQPKLARKLILSATFSSRLRGSAGFYGLLPSRFIQILYPFFSFLALHCFFYPIHVHSLCFVASICPILAMLMF